MEETAVMTEFICKSCSEPIQLGASFLKYAYYTLTPDPLSIPTQELLLHEETHIQKQPPPRVTPGSSKLPEPQDVFILLSKPDQFPSLERYSLSHRLKISNKLFEFVSGISNVPHPLCQDCSDDVTIRLEKKLGYLKKELDSYRTYYESLSTSNQFTNPQILNSDSDNHGLSPQSSNHPTEQDYQKLLENETICKQTLESLDQEKLRLENEFLELEKEMLEVDQLEKHHWQEINDFQHQSLEFQDEIHSLLIKTKATKSHLDKLLKTNVYNDTFRIAHDGPIGTINGMRLGKLSTQPVEWTEINAATGQALFLLDTLAKKCEFKFKMYSLIPMGNFSRIEKIVDGDRMSYELYGTSDLTGMLFWNRRFDIALVAFLHCISQLGDFAERADGKFRLPYRINKDKIGDVSIKLQYNQDDTWTKALKYTLINLKWLIGFYAVDNLKYQYDPLKSAWFPMFDATLVSSQQSIYSVPGVDENEVILPKRKAKKSIFEEPTKKPKIPPPKKPNSSVYVTGLPLDTKISEVKEIFEKYGLLLEDLTTGAPKIKLYKDEDDKLKGDALVTFFKPESVDLCVKLLDDSEFRYGQSNRIRVQPAVFQEKERDPTQIKKVDKKKIEKARLKMEKKLEWFAGDELTKPSEKMAKIVILKNMFTLEELKDDPTLLLDLKDEVRDECEKIGIVTNVVLYDLEVEGIMTVRFKDLASAELCVKKFNGRFFAGRQIEAKTMEKREKFRQSSNSTTDEDDKTRLESFEQWLDKQ